MSSVIVAQEAREPISICDVKQSISASLGQLKHYCKKIIIHNDAK